MLTETERSSAEVALLACNLKIEVLENRVRATPKSDPSYRVLLHELGNRRSERLMLHYLLARHCGRCNEIILTPGECPYCF